MVYVSGNCPSCGENPPAYAIDRDNRASHLVCSCGYHVPVEWDMDIQAWAEDEYQGQQGAESDYVYAKVMHDEG